MGQLLEMPPAHLFRSLPSLPHSGYKKGLRSNKADGCSALQKMNRTDRRRAPALTLSLLVSILASPLLQGEELGQVSTKFRVVGPNDKIVIEAFDDPAVAGVTCYLSRAKTGGVGGAMGIAEDTSDASIACRQTGPVSLAAEIRDKSRDGEEVFRQRTSILFKTMQVVRFYDAKRNTLVYMTYSDKLVDGSPKNSITAVPLLDYRPMQAERQLQDTGKSR